MTTFNYGDIIEYIDETYDENFNEARRWAYSHNTTFEELVDRRKEKEEEETYTEEVPVDREVVVPAVTHIEIIPAEYDENDKLVSKEHKETIIDIPEHTEVVTVYEEQEKTRLVTVLYRYFQIGPEHIPTEDELKAQMLAIRDTYFAQYVDWYQSKPLLWEEMSSEDKQSIADYRQYLKSYNDTEEWWNAEPLDYATWLAEKEKE